MAWLGIAPSSLRITAAQPRVAQPTMTAIRGVVFDLDGTLVDAEPLYKTAYNAVAQEYGKVYDCPS